MNEISPPPSVVELVKDNTRADSIWKLWLNQFYEVVKDLVAKEVAKSAFGEQLVAQITPQIQADFSYNVNPDIWHEHNNGGTSTVDSHRLKISTGAAENQSTAVHSRAAIKYNAGQGGLLRATAIFTTGVANSEQLVGVGGEGDGYFFGYNGADFGVLQRRGGHYEVRTLTVTTASTTSENITITLDGDADATVAVTNTGVISTTANEIADHDYSDLGSGWDAHSKGNGKVVFISYDSSSHIVGAYSLSSATTAVGTIAQDIAGLAPTLEEWTPQTDWNVDKMLGTGSSMTLDTTKGNVYQIQYQWLGFGMVRFYVEHDIDGELELVHEVRYANNNLFPSVNNPTLPVYYAVKNSSNASDIVMYSGSCMGATEGVDGSRAHLHHGVGFSNAIGVSTTEKPVISLHNPLLWQGVPNRKRLKITSAGVTLEGTKPAIARLRRGADLIASSFNTVDANGSVAEWDMAATALETATSNTGDQLYIGGSPKEGAIDFPIDDSFHINPGETLTITLAGVGGSAGNTSMIPRINWEEDY